MTDSASPPPPVPDDGTVTGAPGGDGRLPTSQAEAFPAVARYEIVGKLGEGGMGIVYEAQQRNPRRRVALKVIRGGQFVDESRIRMFQREADTLALLKHANIGAIYESGRTDDGRHFFAMELVHGENLDRYLTRRGPVLTQDELQLRLHLFRQIAEAVQYAHQRGVIHRDLKPSNIVVTEEGAKILDFGLARITEGDLAAATQVTEIGVIKGTLAYMSPEQARGNPSEIDLRTDIYSLGVILYEMLSGKRPYDVSQRSLMEAVRVICVDSAPPLSRSLSGLGRLDPDVETIVAKAMEKDADRRYSSAAELSEDVARYLASQPILARPPSAAYQLRKFASRNKALVGGIAATLVMLVVAIAGTTTGLIRARRAQSVAEKEYASAQRLSGFMKTVIGDYDVSSMGKTLSTDLVDLLGRQGGNLEAVNMVDVAQRLLDKEILQHAVATIDKDLSDDPDLAQGAHFAIGNAYFSLQLFEPALAQLLRCRELIGRVPDPKPADRIEIARRLGDCYRRLTRYPLAERAYLEALAFLHDEAGRGSAQSKSVRNKELEVRSYLGDTYRLMAQHDKAARYLSDTLADARKALGDEHKEVLTMLNNLSLSLQALGRHEEALACLREALAKAPRAYGPENSETVLFTSNLGEQLRNMARFEESEKVQNEAIGLARRTAGSTAWITLMSQRRLGMLYRDIGRTAEAERLLRTTMAVMKTTLGVDNEETIRVRCALVPVLASQGRFAEASELLAENLRIVGAATNSDGRVQTLFAQAGVMARQGNRTDAMSRLREAIEAGYQNAKEMSSDPSLASLHGPAFDDLLARTRRQAPVQETADRPE